MARRALRRHVHHDNDAQVEEDRDDAGEHAEDGERDQVRLHRRAEDVPLRDEADRRRKAAEREQEDRHHRRQTRPLAAEAREVAHVVVRAIVRRSAASTPNAPRFVTA